MNKYIQLRTSNCHVSGIQVTLGKHTELHHGDLRKCSTTYLDAVTARKLAFQLLTAAKKLKVKS